MTRRDKMPTAINEMMMTSETTISVKRCADAIESPTASWWSAWRLISKAKDVL
jgi:hypothetical protein